MSDDYHSDFSHVSKTMLSLFMDSRLEYYHTYITREMTPKPPKKPMVVGTILHSILLEDVEFDDLVRPYPGDVLSVDGKIVSSRAKSFEADNPGFFYMKEQECEAIRRTVQSIMQNAMLGSMIRQATHRELRFDATVEDIDCKCKPDIVCDVGSMIVVYDLKFMEFVDPDSWRRSSKRFRYWAQDSHYSSVLEKNFTKPIQFRFCVIETKFPYRIQWKWYDPVSRETARDFHRGLLRELGTCMASGEWRDGWDSVMVLEPWDLSKDEDLVEVEQ